MLIKCRAERTRRIQTQLSRPNNQRGKGETTHFRRQAINNRRQITEMMNGDQVILLNEVLPHLWLTFASNTHRF